jgi:hypothetical protein
MVKKSMKDKTITVYVPNSEIVTHWKKLAKKAHNIPLSQWIFERVSLTLKSNDGLDEEEIPPINVYWDVNYKELWNLRKQVAEMKKEITQLKKVNERLIEEPPKEMDVGRAFRVLVDNGLAEETRNGKIRLIKSRPNNQEAK